MTSHQHTRIILPTILNSFCMGRAMFSAGFVLNNSFLLSLLTTIFCSNHFARAGACTVFTHFQLQTRSVVSIAGQLKDGRWFRRWRLGGGERVMVWMAKKGGMQHLRGNTSKTVLSVRILLLGHKINKTAIHFVSVAHVSFFMLGRWQAELERQLAADDDYDSQDEVCLSRSKDSMVEADSDGQQLWWQDDAEVEELSSERAGAGACGACDQKDCCGKIV